MIRDYLWQPLVYVGPTTLAYLLHPGSRLKPIVVTSGWTWHWPLLSTIRILEHTQANFVFGKPVQPDRAEGMSCESIVCVSRDHQLYILDGWIELSAITTAEAMPVFMNQSPQKLNRLLQSIVRQSLRSAIAKWPAKQLNSPVMSNFEQACVQELAYHLRSHQLDISSIHISNISVYSHKKKLDEAD